MANREDTNKKAIELGLAGAENYANKGVVEDAIARVEGGASAVEVDKEIMDQIEADRVAAEQANNNGGDAPSTPASRPRADRKEKVESGDPSNDGHATKFDETGAPKF